MSATAEKVDESEFESKSATQLAMQSPCSSVSSLPTLPPEQSEDASQMVVALEEPDAMKQSSAKALQIFDLEAQVQQLEGEVSRVDALEAAVKRLEACNQQQPVQHSKIAAHGGTGTTSLAQDVQLETSDFPLNAVAEAAEEAETAQGEVGPQSDMQMQSSMVQDTASVDSLKQRVDCLAAIVYSRAWHERSRQEVDAATGGLRNISCSIITDDGCTGSCMVSPPMQLKASPRQQSMSPFHGTTSSRIFEPPPIVQGKLSSPSPASQISRVSITTRPS